MNTKTTSSPDFTQILTELNLDPLILEIEEFAPSSGADAYVSLDWEGDRIPFVAEFSNARDLRALQNTVRQARRGAEETDRAPLVVVPYLNDDWLAFLRSEGVSGLDLAGNGSVECAGRWSWFRRGFPNAFPATTPTRAPYRGKSAFVGRVLLARPRFNTISAVQEEIERRGGSLSLGQVSKVLAALEQDLIIRKGDDGVKLLQPERLLDSLAEGYRRPVAVREVHLKASLDADLFAAMMKEATGAGARIAGYEPARYAIAPEPSERLLVYVEPRGFPRASGIEQAEPSPRFANLTIRAVSEPTVFFDTESDRGFKWCSPLETYLQLMQGGKREQESAGQLRDGLLQGAVATRRLRSRTS